MMNSKFFFLSIITIQLICIFFLAINLILVRWEIRENFALQANLIEQNEELTNQHNQLLTEQFFLWTVTLMLLLCTTLDKNLTVILSA